MTQKDSQSTGVENRVQGEVEASSEVRLTLSTLDTDFHSRALTILLCHRFIYAILGGIGISTDCPSSTPFGLNLGPDLPWADEPSPGILRLSTGRILTSLSLLMPAFSLVYCPPPLPVWLLPVYVAPLPI